MPEYSGDAYTAADKVIKAVTDVSLIDHSAGRDEIARVFDEQLWNGNWISSTDFDPALGFKDLRFYQEDEFDQHLDEDETPDEDDFIAYIDGHYVYFA